MLLHFDGLRMMLARSKPSRLIEADKCMRLIEQAQSHLCLLKKRRECMVRQTRSDIAQLLQDQQLQKALHKVKQLYKDQSLLSAYNQIEQFCGCIATNMPQICRTTSGFESLPIDVLEAASSLVFAASRCGELPELNSMRYLFKRLFGYQFEAASVELQKGNLVNSKMKQNLCISSVPVDEKLMLIKEIAEENSLHLWFQDFSGTIPAGHSEADKHERFLSECHSLDSSIDKIKEQNGNSSYSSHHVHPKLPEYEDVVAKLTDLKLKQGIQGFDATPVPGHSEADKQETLSLAFKSSSSNSDPMGDNNCIVLFKSLSLDSSIDKLKWQNGKFCCSGHIHPKLPEYEDVLAKLTDLKVENKRRRLSEGSTD